VKRKYLSNPTRPVELRAGMTCDDLLSGLEGCSFQARALAQAARIWAEALDDDIIVMLGLAGAMVPAGMRKALALLIEKRLIDVVVSTGANLYHDFYETAGSYHYLGSPNVDDAKLREDMVDRIYDTFADEEGFQSLDKKIGAWAARSLEARPYTTREFLHLLGKEANRLSKGEQGILSTAYRKGVPVYCPAIGDSSIGIGLAGKTPRVIFDMVADVEETAGIAAMKPTMVIYVGGGTPKNFIQQTEVTNQVLGRPVDGHRYAIQFVADPPQWGGLSGCTFDEAVSWGKIAPTAKQVGVLCDATIALPIVAAAVLTRRRGKKRPGIPKFEF
jgi:deoxyhypusine synthase